LILSTTTAMTTTTETTKQPIYYSISALYHQAT